MILCIETESPVTGKNSTIYDAFAGVTSTAAMKRLFDEIFTPAEQRDLVLRWELLHLLRDGIPQREIARRLGISLCKITRGSKYLKDDRSELRKLLES